MKKFKLNSKTLLVFFLLLTSLIFSTSTCYAVVTSYHVSDAYWFGSGFGGNYLNASVTVNIDPDQTNWIAWHDNTVPDIYNSQEYVGDLWNWLGVDDYMYLTITNPAGVNSSRLLMDYNSSSGYPSGTQAVIFGDASTAPNVFRKSASSAWLDLDESGAFNSFIDSSTAGNYIFSFEFFDGYSGSYGIPNFNLLVDSNPVVPEPTTMLLFTLGFLGFSGLRRKKKNI